jgi:hypothetical protein
MLRLIPVSLLVLFLFAAPGARAESHVIHSQKLDSSEAGSYGAKIEARGGDDGAGYAWLKVTYFKCQTGAYGSSGRCDMEGDVSQYSEWDVEVPGLRYDPATGAVYYEAQGARYAVQIRNKKKAKAAGVTVQSQLKAVTLPGASSFTGVSRKIFQVSIETP